jgi:2-polyprenyl-3-methyl-5-hydroxy-6-metoxy-1,4-benzoquinol methylase
MPHHLCPPWIAYWLASPLRRLVQKPEQILAGLVTPGMTVVDVGPGMGFFSLPMARMVGPGGRVICVDLQEPMLRALTTRAAAAQLQDRIVTRVCPPTTLDLAEFAAQVDFLLAFAVVHELPEAPPFLAEVAQVLRPNAHCLLAEPTGHVSGAAFEETLAAAKRVGLAVVGRPRIRMSHAAVVRREGT